MARGSIKNSGPTPRPRFNGRRPNSRTTRGSDRRGVFTGRTEWSVLAPGVSLIHANDPRSTD